MGGGGAPAPGATPPLPAPLQYVSQSVCFPAFCATCHDAWFTGQGSLLNVPVHIPVACCSSCLTHVFPLPGELIRPTGPRFVGSIKRQLPEAHVSLSTNATSKRCRFSFIHWLKSFSPVSLVKYSVHKISVQLLRCRSSSFSPTLATVVGRTELRFNLKPFIVPNTTNNTRKQAVICSAIFVAFRCCIPNLEPRYQVSVA